MREVKIFDWTDLGMEEFDGPERVGLYVRTSDYAALEAECERLREEIGRKSVITGDYIARCQRLADERDQLRAMLSAQPQASAAQSAPAGDREALERELLSVLDFSESNLRRVVDHLLGAGYSRAAWQRTQSAGVPVSLWTRLTDRMPDPDEHGRVLIYTEGYDFGGEQVFDVVAETLNECFFESSDEQPEVLRFASHWMPIPAVSALAAAPAQPAAHDQGEVQRLREALESCLELIETISPFEDDTVRKARAALSAQQPSQGEGGAQ